jgi:hypothetical protein
MVKEQIHYELILDKSLSVEKLHPSMVGNSLKGPSMKISWQGFLHKSDLYG